MLVCLACYGDRVAALLETATELRFYRVEQKAVQPCGIASVPGTGVAAIIDLLAGAKVEQLLCGGLSGCVLAALHNAGIIVVPWVGGGAEHVAQVFAEEGLAGIERLRLPGCGQGNCPNRRGGQGCRRGRSQRPVRVRRPKIKAE